MAMTKHRSLQGWVSLPILVLLITVAGLSLAYQQRLEAHFVFRSTLDSLTKSTQLWQAFEGSLVASVDFSLATESLCQGFCPLTSNAYMANANVWRHGEDALMYQWRYYSHDENRRFYRLCARHQQQNYCWWWQEHRLISRGFVNTTN